MRARALSLGLSLGLVASGAEAYCPSYTLSSSANTYNCGVEAVNGTNPTISEWQKIFDTVAKGPPAWGSQGPAVADIGQGCGKPETLHDVPARFPCELLMAIAMAESGWKQFCVPDQPADQVGGASRTIISFDCGYGVGQVTSGMHIGENPGFDRKRVAGEPLYNMATGASILAAKWRATKCVGDNQPSIVEDWYTAVWAYNGLSYKNNPNNPNYSSTRGVWDPAVAGAAPYQEKVFGRIEHPSGSPAYWPSLPLAYPDPANIGGGTAPPDLPEPSCASPTNCTSKRSVHVSTCFSAGGTGGTGGTSGTGGAAGSGGTGEAGAPAGGSAGSVGTGGSVAAGGGASGSVAQGGGTAGTGGQAVSAVTNEGDVDGGCGCALPGRLGSPWAGSALALLALAALGRRGRRAR